MNYSICAGFSQTLIYPTKNRHFPLHTSYTDVIIEFHGARNLPKMDVIGSSDPYFRATIDNGKANFVSACIANTLNPEWNEEWIVRNVPTNAILSVTVYDKDNDTPIDDYIGKFQTDLSSMQDQYLSIYGPSDAIRGQFRLSITLIPNSPETAALHPYIFDGPIRFSRHNSLVVGHLTKVNDERLYSTWEIHLKRIDLYFDQHKKQRYNSSYQAAKAIFEGPMSHGIQKVIKQAHRALYAKHTTNEFGSLKTTEDLWQLFINPNSKQIKPCVYTYVIEDTTWRFSETGASFFLDFASKHALHANCSQSVYYAGEFHLRPKGGWKQYDNYNDTINWNEWELVIDNGSGTYAPDLKLLDRLKALLMFNFSNLNVITYDYKDKELKSSIEECREYAKNPESRSMKTIKHLIEKPLFHPFSQH